MYLNSNRLLILDNDSTARGHVHQLATRLDYDVREAGTLADALIIIKSFSPSLIILDLDLPDTDGIGMLAELAKEECKVPMLIVTGLDPTISDAARAVGIEQGLRILGNLSKPVFPAELSGWLKAALGPRPVVSEQVVRSALENDEFSLHYQPTLYRTENRAWRITGVAGYLRWAYPGYGLLKPAQFLAGIEKSGSLPEVTDRILLQAMQDAQFWQDRGLSLTIGLSIPWYLITHTLFSGRLETLVNELGINPDRLVLNISDVTKSNNSAVGYEKLTRLRHKGFGLAYDGFNNIRSSILDLAKLPFTVINLDSSMVAHSGYEQSAANAVAAVFAVARELDMEVHAKGVAHSSELRILESLDCRSARGHLFGRAMPAAEVESFVRQWNKPTSNTKMKNFSNSESMA